MLEMDCLDLTALTHEQRRECIEVANAACPTQDQTAYLQTRFEIYDAILTARDRNGLAAFQLVQTFAVNGQHYLYLGPLFSRRKAFLPMFLHHFERWMHMYWNKTFHLLAEIQNPDVFLVFKTLFLRTSYPRLDDTRIPLSVQQIAQTFAANVKHIHGLDTSTLSTRGCQTLFHADSGNEAVLSWLRARNVHLERGDSQILLLSIPSSLRQRQTIRAELLRGKLMLKHWHRFRPIMLRKFKEGIPQ